MKGTGKPRNSETGRVPGVGPSKFTPKSKGRKKLGGGGLSLAAFVGAKSKPAINPAQIREHREFYLNAKKVNNYKKLLKKLNKQGAESGAGSLEQVSHYSFVPVQAEIGDGAEGSRSHGKNGAVRKPQFIKGNQSLQFKMQRKMEKKQRVERGPTQLEKLREEVDLKKQEEEEERKEREEVYAREREAREKAHHRREEVQNKMRKKTGRGQPVMKHRMEHLLEAIQKG